MPPPGPIAKAARTDRVPPCEQPAVTGHGLSSASTTAARATAPPCSTTRGASSWTACSRARAGCTRDPRWRSDASSSHSSSVLELTGMQRGAVRAVGLGHARAGERRRRHLLEGRHELLRRRLARLRLPRRARAPPRRPRRLQQRRQRSGALRPPLLFRARAPRFAPRSRRSSARAWAAGSSRRAVSSAERRAWQASSAMSTYRCRACSPMDQPMPRVQLRFLRRRREHRLAHRHTRRTSCRTGWGASRTMSSPGPSRWPRQPSWSGATESAEDALALAIFGQQAMALGRLFTIASNFHRPERLLRRRRCR